MPQKPILFGEVVLSGLNNVFIEQVRDKSAKAVKKREEGGASLCREERLWSGVFFKDCSKLIDW